PESREEVELLLIAELESFDLREAAIVLGRQRISGKFTIEAIVQPIADRGPARGINETADFLVEHAAREHARRFEIILERQVEVVRVLRQQGRIARGDRLIVVVDGGRRYELADGGPADVAGIPQAQQQVAREVVAE